MPQKRSFPIDDLVMADAAIPGAGHHVFLAHNNAKLQRKVFECQVIEYYGGDWQPLAGWKWQAVAMAVTAADPWQVDVLMSS